LTALLEKLFELISLWFWHLMPFVVMGDDQCGLVRRLGRYRRDLSPGLNWKWPVIENGMTETAALGSMTLREQTLATKDRKQITLRGVLAWRVVNPRAFILECDGAQSVINDVGCCVISELVPEFEAWNLLNGDATEPMLRKMRARARKWGIKVEAFGLVDCVETTAYRVITSAPIDLPSGS
jgi:regulator of protease activity HflC (stomatin/prohibitin superfamily)